MTSRFKIDYWLLAPVLVLIIISLTVLFSLDSAFVKSQLLSLVIALVTFLLFSQANLSFLKQLTLPIYLVSLFIFILILILGIESRGAVRWIDVFGVRLQFSEILKPFLSLAFATYLAEQQYPKKRTFFVTLGFLSPIFILIALQPDLGSALIYVGVALLTLIVMGYPLLWFGLALLPFVLVSPLLWTLLHDYQRQRIMTFIHPTADPLGSSYNSIQAMIAVGSGTFFGKGLSEGTQSGLQFLPERHTDFIFATLAEGLGFVGSLIVLGAFLWLFYRVYLVFQRSDDPFSKVFSTCAFGFFLIQFFVNIGMNIGIVPVVGVTLPFVSFGGSSLLSNVIFLGILSAVSTSRDNKKVLEIR